MKNYNEASRSFKSVAWQKRNTQTAHEPRTYRMLVFVLLAFLTTGCASDPQKISDLETKIKILENKIYSIQTKDESEKIESLEARIEKLEKEYSIKTTPEKITDTPSQIPESKSNAANDSLSTEDVQKALKKAGFYEGEIDGKFGPKTKEAIELFQAANGLKVDGRVGPMTWEQLKKFTTEETDNAASAE